MREPQVVCIYHDIRIREKLECFDCSEGEILIEYWQQNKELEDKIENSHLRFDVALLEGRVDSEEISPGILEALKNNYRDIEIIYISLDDGGFQIESQHLPMVNISERSRSCGELLELIDFLCQQIRYKRERKMLGELHKLSLEINSKTNLKDILNHTCRTAVEILNVDHSGFVIFEKELNYGIVEAEYPPIYNARDVQIPVKGNFLEEQLVFHKKIVNIIELKNNNDIGDKVKNILLNKNIKSILIVPVVLNGKVIASFSLDMILKCRQFYKDEIEFCKKLAAHVALAIGNARILKEISVLNEIGMAIGEESVQTMDIKRFVENIRDKTAQLVNVKNFFLLHYDEAEDRYEFLIHRDEKDDPGKVTQDDFRNSMAGYVRTMKSPVIAREKEIKALIDKGVINQVGNLSKVWLGVPLIARRSVIGIMVVQDYHHEEAYDEHDLNILTSIASQAAVAIDNYYLLADLLKQVDQIKVLYETSQEIVEKSIDLPPLLEKIVGKAVELSSADAGQMIFHDSTNKTNKVVLTHNMDIPKGFQLGPGEGMVNQVIKTQKGLLTNDYFGKDYSAKELDRLGFRDKIQGMVQVPLKWKGEIIGVLAMTSKPGDRRIFTHEDVARLEYFAGPAAIAIGIARTISFQQTLLQNSPEAIIASDNKGKVIEFNNSSERIMGYKKKDVMGWFAADFYYDGIEEARKIKKIVDENEREGKPVRDIHTWVKGSQGEKIPILFSGAILKDEFKQTVGTIGLMRDLREIEKIDTKYRKQQSLLADLESLPLESSMQRREELQDHLNQLLQMTCDSCKVRFMALFASIAENDTVLQPIAWWGLPETISAILPHFNWRKADLLSEDSGKGTELRREAEFISKWLPDEKWRKLIINGIKGNNKEYFKDISCGVPVRLADNYRSVLVFGPFADRTKLLEMKEFIKNIALTINVRGMSWLKALYLRTRSKKSENSARLIVHRARMYLLQITGKFGRIKREVDHNSKAFLKANEGEELSINTAMVIKRALTSQIAEMEPEDFHFQSYSLSALIHNCAAAFEERARQMKRKIIVDDTVDYLPNAEVDPHFLAVALGNLIENALKYSLNDTYVKISSCYDSDIATITVYDVGERLSENAKENLLEPGKRWALSARARKIQGTGFGLWDASVIAAAHDGHVDFSSVEYKRKSGWRSHLVKVYITIPLKQEKKKKSES